jgi:hypothetical protein
VPTLASERSATRCMDCVPWTYDYSVTAVQSRLNQPSDSGFNSCSSSPESSQTPPHLTQELIDISSNIFSFRTPSQRGHSIEEMPAALASQIPSSWRVAVQWLPRPLVEVLFLQSVRTLLKSVTHRSLLLKVVFWTNSIRLQTHPV